MSSVGVWRRRRKPLGKEGLKAIAGLVTPDIKLLRSALSHRCFEEICFFVGLPERGVIEISPWSLSRFGSSQRIFVGPARGVRGIVSGRQFLSQRLAEQGVHAVGSSGEKEPKERYHCSHPGVELVALTKKLNDQGREGGDCISKKGVYTHRKSRRGAGDDALQYKRDESLVGNRARKEKDTG